MTFKAFTQIALITTSAIALAACTTNYDVNKTRALVSTGGAFNEALKQKYSDFVSWEQQEGDIDQGVPYLQKASDAAAGKTVDMDKAVDAPSAVWRNKAVEKIAALKASDPVRAATIQVAYDCYNHELGEGTGIHAPGTDLHGCKAMMVNALVDPLVAAPAAKVVTVTMPAPFIVYFDFNKADLTADSKATIADAAKAIAQLHVTKISVQGDTDTVGSAAYNQTLSDKRAAVVEKALEALGVPASEQKVEGFGKTRLKIATPDQTKEARNRRTEIHLEQ